MGKIVLTSGQNEHVSSPELYYVSPPGQQGASLWLVLLPYWTSLCILCYTHVPTPVRGLLALQELHDKTRWAEVCLLHMKYLPIIPGEKHKTI